VDNFNSKNIPTTWECLRNLIWLGRTYRPLQNVSQAMRSQVCLKEGYRGVAFVYLFPKDHGAAEGGGACSSATTPLSGSSVFASFDVARGVCCVVFDPPLFSAAFLAFFRSLSLAYYNR
jgi:hypothetical protein